MQDTFDRCFTRIENLQPFVGGYNVGPFFVFLAATMWACDSVFRPYVSVRLPAEAVVCWEHVIGLVAILPFSLHYCSTRRKALSWHMWGGLIFIGIGADAVANTLVTKGYASGHIALVALLQQLQPIFGVILARLLLHETLGSGRLAWGLACGAFFGLMMMMWPFVRAVVTGNEGSVGGFGEGAGEAEVHPVGADASAHPEANHADALAGLIAACCALSAAFIWAGETVVARYLLHHGSHTSHAASAPGIEASDEDSSDNVSSNSGGDPVLSCLELLVYRQCIGLVGLVVYVFVLTTHPVCDVIGLECWSVVFPDRPQTLVLGIMACLELVSHIIYFVGLNATAASVAVIMLLAHPLWLLTIVPSLIHLVDPTYRISRLESEQTVGAMLVVLCTALLGMVEARAEAALNPPLLLPVNASDGPNVSPSALQQKQLPPTSPSNPTTPTMPPSLPMNVPPFVASVVPTRVRPHHN